MLHPRILLLHSCPVVYLLKCLSLLPAATGWDLVAKDEDHSWWLLVGSEILLNTLEAFYGSGPFTGIIFLLQKDLRCPDRYANDNIIHAVSSLLLIINYYLL